MRFALCNEVLASMPLERQCDYAAQLGYDGLEIAPYTIFDAPDAVSAAEASRVRAIVGRAGLVVTSLHWLLVKPAKLSLTDPDTSIRTRTLEVMTRLTGQCAALGGNVLVHGSPKQRQIAPGDSRAVSPRRRAGGRRLGGRARRGGVLHRTAVTRGDRAHQYDRRGGRAGSRSRASKTADNG